MMPSIATIRDPIALPGQPEALTATPAAQRHSVFRTEQALHRK